jgi:heme/copper-type cytochrome/quinol oxidase subunit 1
MTVTEDAPVAEVASPQPSAPAPAATGLASILGSGDHKVVGRVWLLASLLHLALAGAAALWVSVLRIDATELATDAPDLYLQAFTFRSIAGAFLFVLPWTIGLATFVVPLQVGASTIAFPRAAAAAAWTYLLGGGLVVASYVIDGGALGDDTDGVRLFTLAFLLVLVALVVAWICIATTVIAVRPPGMSLRRVPLFAWSCLVAGTVWVLSLAVLAGVVVIAYIDLRYGGATGFIAGGASTLYVHIAWMFGQPAVYAFAIPVLGFIGSVVPVFSDTRHLRHRVAMGLIGAYGALAAGAWAMPAFGPDLTPWLYEAPWVAVSFAAVVPVLALIGLWTLTLRQGTPRLASPLLYAAASGLMLLVGLLAGALQAIEPIKTLVDEGETSLYGTTVTTSVASYIVLATTIAGFGGLVYWAPKILGRVVSEVGARLVALLLLGGTVLWAFPDLVSGLLGQSAAPGVAPTDNVDAIRALDTVSAIGGGVLALAGLGFVGLLVGASRHHEAPGDDPWSGHTLEWATSSPPPVGNFASLPVIASEAPLYDARHQPQEASV